MAFSSLEVKVASECCPKFSNHPTKLQLCTIIEALLHDSKSAPKRLNEMVTSQCTCGRKNSTQIIICHISKYFNSHAKVINRVRRDPGTRPVLNFFSSTRPVPTRKLKMTGYWVIEFHLESNKTSSWIRNPAIKVTNPINPGTGSHFFAIY